MEIDDLSEHEIADEITAFVKYFDFEGKRGRGRVE